MWLFAPPAAVTSLLYYKGRGARWRYSGVIGLDLA
jgi:hypothetical protein